MALISTGSVSTFQQKTPIVDLFDEQLKECSWRGISFPILLVSGSGGQRLAVHKKVDRDGGQVEDLGRELYQFSVKAPFFNTISKGSKETWSNLFPQTFLKVRAACEDRSTGVFVHPLYGKINCKVVHWTETFSGAARGGVVFEISFMETIDDQSTVAQPTVQSTYQSAVTDLTAQLGQLQPPEAVTLPDGSSLQDLFNLITGTIDQVELAQSQVLGKISKAINSVNLVVDKISDISEYEHQDVNFVLNTDIIATRNTYTGFTTEILGNGQAIINDTRDAILDSLYTMQQQILTTSAATAIYNVTKKTTVATLAKILNNTVDQLITLNNDIVSGPIVPKFYQVRYYTSS